MSKYPFVINQILIIRYSGLRKNFQICHDLDINREKRFVVKWKTAICKPGQRKTVYCRSPFVETQMRY